MIEFPLIGLELSGSKYDLLGVISHNGDEKSRAHTVRVRDQTKTDAWFEIDGATMTVTKVPPELVALTEALVLLYSRVQ